MDDELPGSLAEFTARHPEVDTCCVGGTWHATVRLDMLQYGYVHGDTEAELLAKLTAALGG